MGFIKVCGMKDAAAVDAALKAGVDAIGFVFAKSVRRVTPQQAAELAAPARGKALCVAVTLNPEPALLQEIFEVFKPDVWQSDAEDQQGATLPPGIALWPVLRSSPGESPAQTLQRLAAAKDRVLFEGPRSGTGKVSDWAAAHVLAQRCEVILAGGLSPANVREAIAKVLPFGVDVSSGVELAPGQKSPELIQSFVAKARKSFLENQQSDSRNG
jgi:phosphoribosylanthranilate isomerase